MRKDITGQKFGRLTAIKWRGLDNWQCSIWEMSCECGGITFVSLSNRERTFSCGCLTSEITSERNKKNNIKGDTDARFFKIHRAILKRCSPDYKDYGARGIKCEWKSFEHFRQDMYESYLEHVKEHGEKDTSIDRIDVNGNYSKENCRWATMKQQQRNRRNNRYIKYLGQNLTLAEWEEVMGFRQGTLAQRLYNGWSEIKALTTPIRK